MSLHDHYLANYHFAEKHRIEVKATPSKIYPVIRQLDFSQSRLIRFLFFLRGMPSKMMRLKGLQKENFTLLQEVHDQEIIVGLVGQFWKPNGNLQPITPGDFPKYHHPDFAKATWNFKLQPADGVTVVETETRIFCPSETVRKNFQRYWWMIRPFSGLIRKEMLKAIRKSAER